MGETWELGLVFSSLINFSNIIINEHGDVCVCVWHTYVHVWLGIYGREHHLHMDDNDDHEIFKKRRKTCNWNLKGTKKQEKKKQQ